MLAQALTKETKNKRESRRSLTGRCGFRTNPESRSSAPPRRGARSRPRPSWPAGHFKPTWSASPASARRGSGGSPPRVAAGRRRHHTGGDGSLTFTEMMELVRYATRWLAGLRLGQEQEPPIQQMILGGLV